MSRLDKGIDALNEESKDQKEIVAGFRSFTKDLSDMADFIEGLTPEEWLFVIDIKGGVL